MFIPSNLLKSRDSTDPKIIVPLLHRAFIFIALLAFYEIDFFPLNDYSR